MCPSRVCDSAHVWVLQAVIFPPVSRGRVMSSSEGRRVEASRCSRTVQLPSAAMHTSCTSHSVGCMCTRRRTSDSCLLSLMFNCPPARQRRGSQVLKQTVACVKDVQTRGQVPSGDVPVKAQTGHITELFRRSIQASLCPRATIHL